MSVAAMKLALAALGPTAPECCGCRAEWEIAIDVLRQAIENSADDKSQEFKFVSLAEAFKDPVILKEFCDALTKSAYDVGLEELADALHKVRKEKNT